MVYLFKEQPCRKQPWQNLLHHKLRGWNLLNSSLHALLQPVIKLLLVTVSTIVSYRDAHLPGRRAPPHNFSPLLPSTFNKKGENFQSIHITTIRIITNTIQASGKNIT